MEFLNLSSRKIRRGRTSDQTFNFSHINYLQSSIPLAFPHNPPTPTFPISTFPHMHLNNLLILSNHNTIRSPLSNKPQSPPLRKHQIRSKSRGPNFPQ